MRSLSVVATGYCFLWLVYVVGCVYNEQRSDLRPAQKVHAERGLQLELRGPRCSEGTLLNPCVAYPTIVWGGGSLSLPEAPSSQSWSLCIARGLTSQFFGNKY